MAEDERRGPGRRSRELPLATRHLLPAAWPAADRAAWERAVAPGAGPFDAPGPAHHLRPRTQLARAKAMGNYIAFLQSRGWLVAEEAPADRLTFGRLTAYIAELRGRTRASTTSRMVLDLSFAAAAMGPDHDWAWVRRHPDRPRFAEATASRKPVAPFDPLALIAAAEGLCARADAKRPSLCAAREFRDGVILLLALHRGLRRGNLAAIEAEVQLKHAGDGFTLRFDEAETKTAVPLSSDVPASVAPLLTRYLEHFRPILLGGRPDPRRLWLRIDGAPLRENAFWGLFMRRGAQLLGRPLNPHLVRHTMATTLLTADPRMVGTAAAALQHRGTRSVTTIYDRSADAGAWRVWRQLLRRRRLGTEEP